LKFDPELKDILDHYDIEIPTFNYTFNWGGRRSGQKGGIGAFLYKEHYQSVDLSEFKNESTFKSITYFNNIQRISYYKARKYGCSHEIAAWYACLR
jgi:hypothetical protein